MASKVDVIAPTAWSGRDVSSALAVAPAEPVTQRGANAVCTPADSLFYALFDGDAARLDRHRPFGDLAFDEVAEILRGRLLVGRDFRAERGEPVAHCRRVHRLQGGVVQ